MLNIWYQVENFIQISAATEASDRIAVKVLEQHRVREGQFIIHHLAIETGKAQVDLDAIEVHLDDGNVGLSKSLEFSDLGLVTEPLQKRTYAMKIKLRESLRPDDPHSDNRPWRMDI